MPGHGSASSALRASDVKPTGVDPLLVGEQAQEVRGQRQHVLAAVGERRQLDRVVGEVAEERASRRGGAESAITRARSGSRAPSPSRW